MFSVVILQRHTVYIYIYLFLNSFLPCDFVGTSLSGAYLGSTPVCLCRDSRPECPLGLWSAVLELLSAEQQSQPECTSQPETLPYKALGTVASANFFFPAKQASLSAPHLLW